MLAAVNERVRAAAAHGGPDLDRAILAGRRVAEQIPPGEPLRKALLTNLVGAIRRRFRDATAETDMSAVTTILRDATYAVAQLPPNDDRRNAPLLALLPDALLDLLEGMSNEADLGIAISCWEVLAEVSPAGHATRAGYLSGLGSLLGVRYGLHGRQADLDAMVEAHREAVGIARATRHPQEAMFASLLADAHRLRSGRTGSRADLRVAGAAGTHAVDTAGAAYPHRRKLRTDRALALYAGAEKTATAADLDAAITAMQELIREDATPDLLVFLNRALLRRYENHGHAIKDLHAAVEAGHQAVERVSEDSPNSATALVFLADALRRRFEVAGDDADLDTALTACTSAAAMINEDSPNAGLLLYLVAVAFMTRFDRTGAAADRDAAVSVLARAGRSKRSAASQRVAALRLASELLATPRPAEAGEFLDQAVRLLPRSVTRRLHRADQQFVIGDFNGLAADAAALALAAPSGTREAAAERAFRLLETGRGVLLSQALETRDDLNDLQDRHPELAARFARLRDRLERSAGPAMTGVTEAAQENLGSAETDRHRPARELETVIETIRTQPGFASFGLPPSAAELIDEAADGPVVLLNASRYRSDALLLSTSGITSVPLPGLAHGDLPRLTARFHHALDTTIAGETRQRRIDAQEEIARLLGWLWDSVAGPVLATLGHTRQPSDRQAWPRVWWIPTGLLSQWPIHAAGHHGDSPGDPGRRTVMDRVISSYTPTVRALHRARAAGTPPHPGPARALLVAMPTTPGLPGGGHLPNVMAEVERLQALLPGSTLLREPGNATGPSTGHPAKQNVLTHLAACQLAHFACHAISDQGDPSRSRLLLHDHESDPLTVADLASVSLDQARLAYLSACHTAALGNDALADESIHLTSAFQLAGFPHVIGTLWAVDDQVSATIADDFYTGLRADGGAIDVRLSARSLHAAARNARDALPRTPSLWAAHLHVGP